MIPSDTCTKILLAIITACLVHQSLQHHSLIPNAHAQETPSVLEVRLVGFDPDLAALPVQVKNDSLRTEIKNTPLDVLINDPRFYSEKQESR